MERAGAGDDKLINGSGGGENAHTHTHTCVSSEQVDMWDSDGWCLVLNWWGAGPNVSSQRLQEENWKLGVGITRYFARFRGLQFN